MRVGHGRVSRKVGGKGWVEQEGKGGARGRKWVWHKLGPYLENGDGQIN